MTVSQLVGALDLEVLAMPDPEREVTCGYAGDLLSWVMGRAQSGCCWATVMTNLNVIAVATLTDAGVTVICEGSEVSDEIKETAAQKQVNLLRTQLPIYEFCVGLSEFLK